MKPLFADSFFFLALLNAQDISHRPAVAIASRRHPYVTTDWILMEVGDACAQRNKRQHFLNLLDLLASSSDTTVVRASDELFDAGVDLYAARMDKEWSLTDCISFVVMRQHELTEALTGDHHFEQAGFKALLKQ